MTMKAPNAPAAERKERIKALLQRVASKAGKRAAWTDIKSDVLEAIQEARSQG